MTKLLDFDFWMTREDAAVQAKVYRRFSRFLRMSHYQLDDYSAAGEWMNQRLAGLKPAERINGGVQ